MWQFKEDAPQAAPEERGGGFVYIFNVAGVWGFCFDKTKEEE